MAGLQTVVYETGVSPIGAGGPTGGWVSGDVASLAASASVTCLFDLGPEWRKYDRVIVAVSPAGSSSGFSNVATSFSDTTTLNTNRRPAVLGAATAYASGVGASVTTANGTQSSTFPVMGRFVNIQLTNADGANPMNSSAKVTLAAQ